MLFALPFPVVDPIALEVGPLVVRWYALAYIAGLLGGWWLMRWLIGRAAMLRLANPPPLSALDDFMLWAMLGIIAGGRLGFVLFYNLDYYLQNPLAVLMVWHGGMSFHGGTIGLVLVTALFAWRRGLPFWSVMDLVALVAPLGLFFGRLANFVNGELYGRVSDVPWAVLFPRGGYVPRHPSQLYEAGLEGAALLALLMLAAFAGKALRIPGRISALFLLGYGVARFVVELYREPDAQLGFLFAGATMGQLLCVPMLVAGMGLMIYSMRYSSLKNAG